MAFQVADDVLDLAGTEAEAGKTLGTDVAQRKLTLPLIHLLRRSGPEESRRLRQLLEQPSADRAVLRDLLHTSGAIRAALAEAERFARSARQALHAVPPSESRQILEDLAVQVVHRSR